MGDKRQRSKNLSESDIDVIVRMLDGWTGRLTWYALVDAIRAWQDVDTGYSRQALHLHGRIRIAYLRNKKRLSETRMAIEKERTAKDRELIRRIRAEGSTIYERYARLEAEINRLKAGSDGAHM